MTTAIPTASDLEKLNTQFLRAQAEAIAKQKNAPRGYALQGVNTGSLERDLAKLVQDLEDVSKVASAQPAFGKLYAAQIDAARKLLQTAKAVLANKSILATIVLAPLLKMLLPMVSALQEASKRALAPPARTIAEQVSDVMKKIFVAGDLGPNSTAVKHAVKVDMPARGGTVDKLRAYLLTEATKKWYRSQFGLR